MQVLDMLNWNCITYIYYSDILKRGVLNCNDLQNTQKFLIEKSTI
jgi:hypothetical protein